MRLSNHKAFTLVEILVAGAIAGTVVMIAYQQLASALRFTNRNQDHFELEKAKVILVREVGRLFERSRRISFRPIGAVVGGFSVNGQGSVTFQADLRPCLAEGVANGPQWFNPVTATNTNPLPGATASSYTLVSLVCCAGGPAALPVVVNNPFGGTYAVTPACRRGPGLTINYRRGTRDDSRCIGDFGDSNASIVAMRYQQAVAFDQSRVRHNFANLFIRDAKGNSIVAPNTGSYTPGAADALAYLSFFSNDSIDTGQANQRITGRSDQQALTEYFGRLGNLLNNRYIPCGRGVQD